MKKWEISALAGVTVMLLWCAVDPGVLMRWWGVAFAPLCDAMNGAHWNDADIVVRSRIWELLQQYLVK